MASSWYAQIPTILTLFRELKPRSVLDVGKGLGKYGFLLHEYYGLDDMAVQDPTRIVAQQSRLVIDCVESEPNFLWPHIPHFYRTVYQGRVEKLLHELPEYQIVFMCDVIEHIEKFAARRTVEYFLATGAIVVISSPANFFHQDNWGSKDEQHLSYWTPNDFRSCCCQWQRVASSRVYVLSREPLKLKTFGRGPWRSLKRIAHSLMDEIS